ncbi:ecdysone receptor isoform X2 [Aplysia californica]|uniref:Ecdysone receptor isoform X2 n=1 Tax=Aplysia californica TaxID=6500 RepID=A0ABM0JAI3_APLCA|nr:ecdysone receptor isoform X2 [Aplysia californica]
MDSPESSPATPDIGQVPGRTSGPSKREQKRRPKPKDGTVLFCGVCGDRALGYNFDAISCESCKAFFRRNALKTKPFTCSFEGNCKLDPHTRKFCSGCRLKKCFNIGMKRDWILNEDQLVKRRQRQHLRQQTSSLGEVSPPNVQPCSSTSGDPLNDDLSLTFTGISPDHESPSEQRLTRSHSGRHLPAPLLHHPHHHLRHQQHQQQPQQHGHCTDSNSEFSSPSSATLYSEPSSSTSSVSPSPLGFKRQYSHSFSSPSSPSSTTPYQSPRSAFLPQHSHAPQNFLPSTPADSQRKIPKVEYVSEDEDCMLYNKPQRRQSDSGPLYQMPMSNDAQTSASVCDVVVKTEDLSSAEDLRVPLNPYINERLMSLKKTYDDIFEAAYTQDQAPKLQKKPHSADQLYNMTDVFIRRLIRFAKHIPEFKSLSQADQIHLLKGGVMEMFVLRSAMGFDAKSNAWKFKVQQGNIDQGEGKLDSGVINNTLGSSMFMQHMMFVRQIQEITKSDRIILMLLFIIQLMSPDRPNLGDKRSVSQSQERHSMWLKAYLESQHSVEEAGQLYPLLLLKLQDVRSLGAESCQLAAHLDINNLEPLLVEVFDLK